ncbi:RNA polymerase, sigma 54 subunit, RpoN [Rhodopirellula sallentina SM41]|uniref:RNA polymerase, sigma 54 subunit, RpoN n=1 Tax=Rhodopirellula sallentina SM41 TaxID=1263870 RepID=M5U8W4_9BACT|nr:RNA polymerase factor sigma-54 [Rhodopirellula sallentina]EMI52413.1 RNA polymerase, sigma 54 subunit, RpoN [Rhodopirellula sallentina SM41]
MRMSVGLHARQSQVQKLAPRMIQSMEILQMPTLALQERIEQEMNENPLLEQVVGDPLSPEESDDDGPTKDTRSEDEKELVVDNDHDNKDDFERLLNMDAESSSNFDDSFRRSANRMSEEADRRHDMMANAQSRPESLNDYLLHQLAELDIDDNVEQIAERIISTLNASDGGYLRSPIADMLPPGHTKEDLAQAEEALRVVQSLEPTGIAARDLAECLILQLDPNHPHYEELEKLIRFHLNDLAENRLPQISKKTGYSIEQIQELRNDLHLLNPKPGAAFLETYVPNVTPDIILEQDESGEYRVRLDDDRVPNLFISEYYRRRLQASDCTAEEREFIKQKINGAQWLIDSIEQRRSTLTKVAEAIVEHQRRFLDEGPEAIEPLKMQQIADKVGVHVTTVSRAVDDKWIQTPRGILPLRRFFVGGTQTEDGDDVAWDTIRLKLQELIDKEDKSKPFSDEALVDELRAAGMTVARRTVTKYRKKMGIPSSRQRRDWTLSS